MLLWNFGWTLIQASGTTNLRRLPALVLLSLFLTADRVDFEILMTLLTLPCGRTSLQRFPSAANNQNHGELVSDFNL